MWSLVVLLSIIFIPAGEQKLAEARQGCCSHHGGVCGCKCCDGSPLSLTCTPYYTDCENNTHDETYKGDAWNWAEKGKSSFEKQQYEKALTYYSHALSIHQASYYYIDRAQVYQALKRYEKALSDIEMSISLCTKNDAYWESAHVFKTHLLIAQNRYDDALITLNRLLKTEKNNISHDTRMLRVRILIYKEYIDQAFVDINKMLAKNIGLIGDNEIKNRYNDVFNKVFIFIEKINPNTKPDIVHYALGRAYFKFLKFNRAINSFNRAISLNKDNNGAYYYRSMAYFYIGDTTKSFENLNESVKYIQKNLDIIPVYALEKLLPVLNVEQINKLNTYYTSLVSEESSYEATTSLATINIYKGNFNKAETLLTYLPVSSEVLYLKGQVLLNKHDLRGALNTFKNALEVINDEHRPLQDRISYYINKIENPELPVQLKKLSDFFKRP